jgi:ketosteroid isomerase-like protein
MARITSAGYVATVLRFLQAYNAGDLDACEELLDPRVEWIGAVDYGGREQVREMLEGLRSHFSQPHVRPEDFRESGGHVLMIVCLTETDPHAPRSEQRQSWLTDIGDDGLITRVVAYARPADAARALEALIPPVHA